MAAKDDAILKVLFAETGCPYAPGTVDSVVWLLGFKAGVERAKAMVDRDLGDQPSAVFHWLTPPQRERAN
jgi:hypothetical protein